MIIRREQLIRNKQVTVSNPASVPVKLRTPMVLVTFLLSKNGFIP